MELDAIPSNSDPPITPITSIKLNAIDLAVRSASLHWQPPQAPQQLAKPTRIITNPDEQTLTLEFPSPGLPTNTKTTLSITFSGRLNEKLAGFYKSTVQPGRVMGVTQFEATDARRALPCWDEPARKATFKVTITTSPKYTVLCNTKPEAVSVRRNGTSPSGASREECTWRFARSPVMSTYLLAFVVTDYVTDYLAATSPTTNVETRVWVPQNKAEQAKFALECAVKSLDLFTRIFQVPYPLPKCDHIAIPDFAAGAMENWGLITYREVRLLVDEATTTTTSKRDVARVIAHELSHQWFGNLTTMEWWTDLWLNEGFARFCEFVALGELYPEFNAELVFDLDVLGAALRLDALQNSHPIRVDVGHPDTINEIFDAISYAKGASVIRALTHFLPGGRETFFRGVRLYLEQFKYRNAVAEDLWRCLARGADMPEEDVLRFVTPWTTKTGSTSTTTSTVERFHAQPTSATTPANAAAEALARRINELGDAAFVLNADVDLFRVAYTETQYRRLAQAGAAIPPRARLAFWRDAFDLAESGDISVAVPLELCVRALPKNAENQVAVLLTALRALNSLCDLYEDLPFLNDLLRVVVRPCVEPLARMLGPFAATLVGPDQDRGLTDELRVNVIKCCSFLEKHGLELGLNVGQQALDLLTKHCTNVSACPAALRAIVFKVGAGFGGTAALKTLLARYESSGDGMERREILNALGGLSTPELLSSALDFVCTSASVRSQDVPLAISSMSGSSRVGARLVWARFQSDFEWWWSRFSDGNFLWSGIVGAVAGSLPTVAEAESVRAFFAEKGKPLGSAQRALNQAIEKVKARAAQAGRDAPNVEAFLESWGRV